MRWLAKQYQNHIWSRVDDFGYWTGRASLGNSLLLQNGRRLAGIRQTTDTSSYADYFTYHIANSCGVWLTGEQTFFMEFAVDNSSTFAMNLYNPASNISHELYLYANPTTKKVNSYTALANVSSYGVFETPYRSANDQQIYIAWMTVNTQIAEGTQRQTYIYPQYGQTTSDAPWAGIHVGHVQVRDGGLDFTTDPIYGLGPWVVTSGAAALVGSLEAVMLPTPGATLKGQRHESKHESQSGKQYRYTWGHRDSATIPLAFVNCRDATLINSFWKAEEKLVYFDDENTIVVSGTITNRTLPLSVHQKPLLDRWKGSIDLEGY